MRLWRISEYADLSGRGGLEYAARWNNQGRPIVYTAESSSGALNELLAHTDSEFIPPDYQLLTIHAADDVSLLEVSELPSTWQYNIAHTQALGDKWLESNNAALLRVPSALITHAFNILINPLHPDAARIKIVTKERVPFDARLK